MCEPYHSIVQYPKEAIIADRLHNCDTESYIKAALGKGYGLLSLEEDWIHLSKFGEGHHSKANNLFNRSFLYTVSPTLWEGEWWTRTFKIDSFGRGSRGRAVESEQAAFAYHNRSVMGNMSLFRRFLETSMLQTRSLMGAFTYVDPLLTDVLTSEGANQLLDKFQKVFDDPPYRVLSRRGNRKEIERGIKVVMGFTRKRELFQSHFADDDSLWRVSV